MSHALLDNIADLLVWTEDGYPITHPSMPLYRVWIDRPPANHTTCTEGRADWWWMDTDKARTHSASRYRYFATREAAEAALLPEVAHG